MNPMCRICFGEQSPETLIMPCRCRGTSAFVHQACIQTYLHHYPDGICRVCRSRIDIPDPYAFAILAPLGALSYFWFILQASSAPFPIKIWLFVAFVIALTWCAILRLIRGWTLVGMMLVSMLITNIRDKIALLFVGTCLLFAALLHTMLVYIPFTHVILMLFLSITFLGAGFVGFQILTALDPYASGAFFLTMFLTWMVWIQARLNDE